MPEMKTRILQGYAGKYRVCENGRVQVWFRNTRWKTLAVYARNGLPDLVRFQTHDGKYVSLALGRLVLTTFVGVRPPNCHVYYCNGNKHDHSLPNLEWRRLPGKDKLHTKETKRRVVAEYLALKRTSPHRLRNSVQELSRHYGMTASWINRLANSEEFRQDGKGTRCQR